MAISINTHTPAQIPSQDLAGGQNAQTTAGTASPAAAPEALPSQSDQIAAHAGLVALANATGQGSVGRLVKPDLDGEGARLQALQLRQQLGAQTVSIANQAPQALLALLR